VGTKGTLFSVFALSIYLTTIIGVGRYSCHCDHASQISILGIKTECSCVKEIHKKDPNHHCVCGAHLETKQPKKDDCCSLKYFVLNTDHYSANGSFSILIDYSPAVIPPDVQRTFLLSVVPPKIKTFQALFHRGRESLFEKNQQLIL
jgi:hypothetical protein